MKLLALNEIHERLGARMTEFAGWWMPLHYGSAVREALAVRQSAGLFDISHMGRLELSGKNAPAILDYITTNDICSLNDGRARYTLFLNDVGGVIDDAVVYRHKCDEFYIIVNAANLEKDIKWIEAHLEGEVLLVNWTDRTVFFALQGPRSPDLLAKAVGPGIGELRRFSFLEVDIDGSRCAVSRTGYTGEDGFEIAARTEDAEGIWTALRELGGADLEICGLAARDILRIEAGYPLYGHEIDESINPIEADLMRFVRLEKEDFVGKDAVLQAMSKAQTRKLTGIILEGRWVPRVGDSVFYNGRKIGYVSSGTFSPILSRGIAMAFIEPKESDEAPIWVEGEGIEVEIHGTKRPGIIKHPPLYERRNVHGV